MKSGIREIYFDILKWKSKFTSYNVINRKLYVKIEVGHGFLYWNYDLNE